MVDLLVGSLMADGGLESALNAAITAEIQVWSWECVREPRGAVLRGCELRLQYHTQTCEEITPFC